MSDLQFHDAAAIFPLMTGDDFDKLVEDIREHGLREPVAMLDGKILDGRNRYRACLLAGVKCQSKTIKTDDPAGYVLSENLHRRHLTIGQRADIGAKAQSYRDAAKKRQEEHGGTAPGRRKNTSGHVAGTDPGESRDQAGAAVGVSGRSIQRVKYVHEHGIQELQETLAAGKITVNRAARIAKLSPSDQQKALARKLNPAPSKSKPKRPEGKRPHTLSEKAKYIKAWVANGEKVTTACASCGIHPAEYTRASLVVASGNADLIEAMDDGLLAASQARKALKTPEKIAEILEKARYLREKKNHRDPSTAGKTKPQLLLELLGRTYTDWKGAECNLKVNSHVIPSDPKKLADVTRLCRVIRAIVNSYLDQVETEVSKCSAKTADKKTS